MKQLPTRNIARTNITYIQRLVELTELSERMQYEQFEIEKFSEHVQKLSVHLLFRMSVSIFLYFHLLICLLTQSSSFKHDAFTTSTSVILLLPEMQNFSLKKTMELKILKILSANIRYICSIYVNQTLRNRRLIFRFYHFTFYFNRTTSVILTTLVYS